MEVEFDQNVAPARSAATGASAASITVDEVREQLDRILGSTEFRVPDRAKNFLRYIVRESLEGHADRLKAYSIGLEVFGRGADFDAQLDPVVRTEAGRLRQALERYYLVAGQRDPIVISVPKGGYVPVFERACAGAVSNSPKPPPQPKDDALRRAGGMAFVVLSVVAIGLLAGWIASSEFNRNRSAFAGETAPAQRPPPAAIETPTIRVEQFINAGSQQQAGDLGIGLTAEIVNQLAKFKNLLVIVGSPSSRPADRDVPPAAVAGFVLTGNIQLADERIRVWTQLMDGETGAVLWSHTYDKQLDVDGLLSAQDDIAKNVAITLGQPYGMLTKGSVVADRRSPDDFTAYTCTLSYYAYRVNYDRTRHADVRSCLERTVAQFPEYATAWALLAMTYIDEDRFAYNPEKVAKPALVRALDAANRAVALDPTDTRGLHALMVASFLNQDVVTGTEIGNRAMELNPNDMILAGEYGIRIALAGDRERGAELIRRAMIYDGGNSNLYTEILAVITFFNREPIKAAAMVDHVNVKNNPIFLLTACTIYGQSGRSEDAASAARDYMALGTKHLENLEQELSKRNFSASDKAYFIDGLLKAGLAVPTDIVGRYVRLSQSEATASAL